MYFHPHLGTVHELRNHSGGAAKPRNFDYEKLRRGGIGGEPADYVWLRGGAKAFFDYVIYGRSLSFSFTFNKIHFWDFSKWVLVGFATTKMVDFP